MSRRFVDDSCDWSICSRHEPVARRPRPTGFVKARIGLAEVGWLHFSPVEVVICDCTSSFLDLGINGTETIADREGNISGVTGGSCCHLGEAGKIN